MMATPSKESGALAELYKELAAAFPQEEDLFLFRIIYEGVHRAASEPPGVSYEDTMIAGRPCKWVRPANASDQHVILYMHGGGYMVGSPDGHRKLTGHLAKACNCLAISVDYRLAPEHKFPTALDDCVNVYKYLLDQGFKPEHIVTAGDSCGGNLSTAVPLAAMAKGYPAPGAVVSLSPWYDLTGEDEMMTHNEDNDVLNTKPLIAGLADKYVSGSGHDLRDPLVSPIFADLHGLPPHWISIGGHDMLRGGGEKLAEKAKKAGVEVVLDLHEQQQHVSEFMAGKAPEANESIERIGRWVRQKIGC